MTGVAGIVLAGGRSTRMGSPKAGLEWHGSTLLRRTAGILARFGPVVVVRAAGQDLPPLPGGLRVIDDPRAGLGPLQGIAAGLAAVRAELAFVCSTDLPFLHPAFVGRVLGAAAASGADVALPLARGFRQPLAAAYRPALAPLADRLVAAGRLRPAFLLGACSVECLDEAALLADPVLAALDPGLDSLVNVNDPAGYAAARERMPPLVTVGRLGAPGSGAAARTVVRAATVGGAAAAVGAGLDGAVAVMLNGRDVAADGQLPLAAGDTVVLIEAAGR